MTDPIPQVLPTVDKTEGLDLAYLLAEEMTENHLYKNAQLFEVTYHTDSKYPYFRWIFKVIHNNLEKYVSYMTSSKLSDTSKMGELVKVIMGIEKIPDSLDINSVRAKGKTIGLRVYIEIKNKYPTVTKIIEPVALHETGLTDDNQTTLEQTNPQPQPQPQTIGEMANEPDVCYYCNEPLPPNPNLITETTYNGVLVKLCPKHKDSLSR